VIIPSTIARQATSASILQCQRQQKTATFENAASCFACLVGALFYLFIYLQQKHFLETQPKTAPNIDVDI
jgi:hypothetical protein